MKSRNWFRVFFERELSLLVSLEHEPMSLIHLCPVQLKVFSGSLARKMVPPIGEHYTAYIYE
jgi:hypothetical protein